LDKAAQGDADQAEAEPGPGASAATSRWPRLARRQVALGLFALAGWAGTLGFGLAWAGQSSQSAEVGQVKQVATDFVMALTNFNPSTIDADFNRVIDYSTGTFATQAHQFFDTEIRQQLQKALASSRGQVRDLFVQSIDGNQATVYAVVDQTYVNSKTSTPQTDTLRLLIGLTDLSNGWHVSSVGVLNQPGASVP